MAVYSHAKTFSPFFDIHQIENGERKIEAVQVGILSTQTVYNMKYSAAEGATY